VLLGSGFREVKPRSRGETARLLVDWQCPHCGAAGLWAVVQVLEDDGSSRVTGIEAAPRTPETLHSVHAVSGLLADAYAFGKEEVLPEILAALEESEAEGRGAPPLLLTARTRR
jgi:hypothetical protein